MSEVAVRIIEQPCKALRYRYKCEGRPALIQGASGTEDNKVPFGIQISGYSGRVQIVMSCVTKDEPHKPHPHNLVGEHCKNGYYFHETKISPENSIVTFSKIRLQCVKRNKIPEELQMRQNEQVDPFITGFAHKNDVRSIDLHVVRLAIQVFLVNENRRHSGILNPIVSDPIFNNKQNPKPKIHAISHLNSYANGRDDNIILLCTKINKDDIDIKFYQMENDEEIWKDYGTFHPNHVYNNTAICFRPPLYNNLNIREPVQVFIQLVRPSDGTQSSSVKFEYLPMPAVRSKSKNALFEELINMTKNQNPLMEIIDSEIFQPSNLPIKKTNEHLLAGGASWMVLEASDVDSKPENLPAWMVPPVSENISSNMNLPIFSQASIVSQAPEVANRINFPNLNPAWMQQTSTASNNNNLPDPLQTWAPPVAVSKKNSLPESTPPWMQPHPAAVYKKNSLPDWMALHGSEETSEKANLPAFAQLLSREELDSSHQPSRPIKVPRFESSSWAQNVPYTINNINKTESESRRNAQGDIYPWNIQEDLAVDSNVNVDSASGISKILDIDCNQIHLEPFSISSGDLEMTDVKHLSGSLQEHLILMD